MPRRLARRARARGVPQPTYAQFEEDAVTSPARSPIDLADPNHYADGIPHALLAQLRRTSPIVWVDEPATGTFPGGPGFWAVLRHAEVAHVSRTPADFSSWRGTSMLRDPRPSDVRVLRRMMLNMDPPEHSKLRKIVNRAFTPQAIRRQLFDSITRHARAVVDAVCEEGKIDFVPAVAGDRLSDDDLDRFFQLLVIAGNDTTRNLLSNTLLTLSQHPGQFARLRGDLGLLPSALEEVLRFAPSVIQFRRTATRDLELAGQHVTENDKVEINYASANRDETVFADPDRFDITRDPNPHLSFGDGTHFCLGANLARLNARTLLTELLTRLPDIQASGPPARLRSSFMNGINHLPAEFTPVPPR